MPAHEPIAAPPAEDMALLHDAAARAGEIAMGYFRRTPDVWMKAGQSPVSEADIAVDTYLKETLLAARPDYGWLSEETVADTSRLKAARSFVVDPIDGTRAFINGEDTWCVSVAVVETGRPVAGVLICPVKDEVFAATLGGEATLNGRAIRVRENAKAPVVAAPKKLDEEMKAALGDARLLPYIPSLAYRVALVAAGRIDATLVKPNAHDWDIAAADLILRMAGGELLTPQGEPPAYARAASRHGALIAASGGFLARLVAEVRRRRW